MPVQYLMIYLDKDHWKKWETLSPEEKRDFKKKLQSFAYRKLDGGK